MKRRILSALIIILLIGLGVLGYEYFGKADSMAGLWRVDKTYDTLEDIKEEADLVVHVHVPLYYDVRQINEEGTTTKQAFYEVGIEEVFLDETGHGFDEDSEIVVNQVIGLKEDGNDGYSSGQGMKPMKTGEYLLFLKKITHPSDGKSYYVPNSAHHLYKSRGSKTFKNIASDELKEIKYSELAGWQ